MNIEKYLVLNKYLLSLFGVSDFRDLQGKLRDVSTNPDSEGRSHFVRILQSFENLKLSEDNLLGYDANIQSYVKRINYRREPVSLKYFQYLAVIVSIEPQSQTIDKDYPAKLKLCEEFPAFSQRSIEWSPLSTSPVAP